MRRLGTIEGIGRLIVDSADVCEASYRISVYEPRPSAPKRASGTLEADFNELRKAWHNRSTCALKLETGDEVFIIITRITDSGAIIDVSGPVPGF